MDLDEDEGVEGRMDGPGGWLRGKRVRGQGREDGDGKGGKGGKTGSGGWMGWGGMGRGDLSWDEMGRCGVLWR